MRRAILYLERLNFVARGPALTALVLVVVTFAYAGWSGDRWRDALAESLAAFEVKTQQEMDDWRTQLADIEAGDGDASPFDANPMSITFAATLPPSSLADFAVGHADLLPSNADISPWRNVTSVFGRYQFDNPTTLSSSSFDVSTVVIVLMPLLMIAISFDILASERSRGSLAMVLSTPVSQSKLVWTRLAFRNTFVWLVALFSMIVLYVLNDAGGDRLERFALWIAISLMYALFWVALIAYCVARCRAATTTVGTLVGLWLLFTLALPATIATTSEALYPAPSRLALLSQTRTAQGETNRALADVTAGFLLDHPDLSVGDEGMPSYMRAAFLSNEAARESTGPIVADFENVRAGRQRAVQWAQHLSPAVIAQRLLLLSAGGDLDRQHRFQSQVQDSLATLSDAIGPAIVSRNRLSLREYDQLQAFTFDDVRIGQVLKSAIGPASFLLFITLTLGAAASRRLSVEQV